MRKLFIGFAVGVVSLIGAQTAQAGPLLGATLNIAIGTLPPATFTAGPGGGTVADTLSNTQFTLFPGGAPTGAATTTVPLSAAPPISKIAFVINGNPASGTFGPGPAPIPITGTANIIAYGGITLLAVPLTIGSPVVILPPPAYGVGITGFANSWTTGATTIALTTPTANGATTAMVTGFSQLSNTAIPTGSPAVVQLVSGLNILTNIAGQLPTFAILTLVFAQTPHVPEPGTLLLLGSGIAGLVFVGRKKMRT